MSYVWFSEQGIGGPEHDLPDLTGKSLEEAIELAREVDLRRAYDEEGNFRDTWSWDLLEEDTGEVAWSAEENMPARMQPQRKS
jgi:hypothetical protein